MLMSGLLFINSVCMYKSTRCPRHGLFTACDAWWLHKSVDSLNSLFVPLLSQTHSCLVHRSGSWCFRWSFPQSHSHPGFKGAPSVLQHPAVFISASKGLLRVSWLHPLFYTQSGTCSPISFLAVCPSSDPFSTRQAAGVTFLVVFFPHLRCCCFCAPPWDAGTLVSITLNCLCSVNTPSTFGLWAFVWASFFWWEQFFSCVWPAQAQLQCHLGNFVIQSSQSSGHPRALCNRLRLWASHTGGVLGTGAFSHRKHLEQCVVPSGCLIHVCRTN